MAVQQRLYSADDLLEMHLIEDNRVELVRGELVELPPAGDVHTLLSSFLHYKMYAFVDTHQLPGFSLPVRHIFAVLERN